MRYFVSLILVVTIFLSSCGTFNKVLKSTDVDYKYKKAVKYYNDKKYSYVIQIFDDRFFPQLKGMKEFEEAFYMLAYSHYYEKDYFNAENLFRQFSETFATSERAVEMEYMRAYTFYKQSPKVELEQINTMKTIGMMVQFINRHPNSPKTPEALKIIEKCQAKVEEKDLQAAKLYYNMGQFKAASVAFANMLSTFPETNKGDEYKYLSIKSFYQYAMLSVEYKKKERLEQVLNDCNDFIDKYAVSTYIKDIEKIISNCNSNIK
jgi:outer membrane protein assembly factor BamD